jgi:hypothetical protein
MSSASRAPNQGSKPLCLAARPVEVDCDGTFHLDKMLVAGQCTGGYYTTKGTRVGDHLNKIITDMFDAIMGGGERGARRLDQHPCEQEGVLHHVC